VVFPPTSHSSTSRWVAVRSVFPRWSSQVRNWIAALIRARAFFPAPGLLVLRLRARRSTDHVAYGLMIFVIASGSSASRVSIHFAVRSTLSSRGSRTPVATSSPRALVTARVAWRSSSASWVIGAPDRASEPMTSAH